jgi:hypothetical protein
MLWTPYPLPLDVEVSIRRSVVARNERRVSRATRRSTREVQGEEPWGASPQACDFRIKLGEFCKLLREKRSGVYPSELP